MNSNNLSELTSFYILHYRSLWFGGHSAGAHLAATLLCSDWLNQLDANLKEIFQGVVLISGIYHLSPLINTSINDAVGLTW